MKEEVGLEYDDKDDVNTKLIVEEIFLEVSNDEF